MSIFDGRLEPPCNPDSDHFADNLDHEGKLLPRGMELLDIASISTDRTNRLVAEVECCINVKFRVEEGYELFRALNDAVDAMFTAEFRRRKERDLGKESAA